MRKKKRYSGYKGTIPSNLKVVSINKDGGIRYVIIDVDTGEVFDDAQGWGYKTAQNAHRALAYKSRPKEVFAAEAHIEKEVHNFWKEHKSLSRNIDDELFISAKEGIPISQKDLEAMIPDEIKEKLTFDIKYLFKFR